MIVHGEKTLVGHTARIAGVQEAIATEILAHQYQADHGTALGLQRVPYWKEKHEACVENLSGALRLIDAITDTITDPTDYSYPFQVARHIPDEKVRAHVKEHPESAWWQWVEECKVKYAVWERGEEAL